MKLAHGQNLSQSEFYSSNLSGSMLYVLFFGPLFSKGRASNKELKGRILDFGPMPF
jgi:hypothetical protein